MNNLLSRGMMHRDVLEKNFDPVTIKHVALMESNAETMVVIVDRHFKIIRSSNTLTNGKKTLIKKAERMTFTHHGEFIESNWKTAPYLATISPIRVNNEIDGYVFMFLSTKPLNTMIKSLTMQFVLVGIFATLLSILTLFFLSRFLTMPLIQMKKATEKLSEGKSNVLLNTSRKDELGELARSIQKLSNDLERLKIERSEFLSSISHELRTPLTFLKGYTDILVRPNLSNAERDEYVSIIQEEASNLTKLVKNLFDLAKMDQHYFVIRKEKIEICSFLNEMITKFKPAYEEKKIALHFSCNHDIFVSVDPLRFGQVIYNLVDNALKYSPTNSNVCVTATQHENQVMIKVADEGIGIPHDELHLIWDRLYRVDKSRSRATGGTGLGLAIAKEIIVRHGGSIYVQSTEGAGTTFTIYLRNE